MFLGLAAILLILTVPLLGGRLSRLADIKIRALPLLLLALLVQILVTVTFTSAPTELLAGLHVASYAAAGWVLWANRRVPGLWLIGLGAGLNIVTIVANGGTLPANAGAERAAGIDVTTNFANSGVVPHPHLAFLGDTMSSPSFLPFRNVLSIGDLVVLAGLLVLVHVSCGSRLRLRPTRGPALRSTADDLAAAGPPETDCDSQSVSSRSRGSSASRDQSMNGICWSPPIWTSAMCVNPAWTNGRIFSTYSSSSSPQGTCSATSSGRT
jgi:hypothetical protein